MNFYDKKSKKNHGGYDHDYYSGDGCNKCDSIFSVERIGYAKNGKE